MRIVEANVENREKDREEVNNLKVYEEAEKNRNHTSKIGNIAKWIFSVVGLATVSSISYILGKNSKSEVFIERDTDPVDISMDAVSYAKSHGFDAVILDTAGRLHIDEKLMNELRDIKDCIKPTEILFVVEIDMKELIPFFHYIHIKVFYHSY